VSQPYVTGQRMGSLPCIGETDGNYFSLADYARVKLEVAFGLELWAHR
jgi:hypothetical protein